MHVSPGGEEALAHPRFPAYGREVQGSPPVAAAGIRVRPRRQECRHGPASAAVCSFHQEGALSTIPLEQKLRLQKHLFKQRRDNLVALAAWLIEERENLREWLDVAALFALTAHSRLVGREVAQRACYRP